MAVEDDPQAAAGATGGGNGGIEEELAVVRRLCFAADSPRGLRRTVQKFLVPLVAGTGGTEPPPQGGYPRPVTRALALLVVELALSATANDYKGVGRAVREAVGVGLGAAGRWPLLPEVLATVLTAAQPRCSFGEARVAALRLWGQLLEHELRPTKPLRVYKKKRPQQDEQEPQDENEAPAPAAPAAPTRTPEEAAKSEVVGKAVAAQAALLDGLAAGAGASADGGRHRAAGEAEVRRVLQLYPGILVGLYRSALTGAAAGGPSLGLLGVLVAHHRAADAAGFGATGGVKAELLEVYLRETLQAKTKPTPQALAGFAPLLAAVTHEDMAAVLAPALEKALKKSPSGVVGAVAALAAQLPLDLSRYVEALLLPPALRLAKSVDEEPREQAVQLLAALAGKVADPAVFAHAVAEAANVLLGKAGVLSQWSQRHALASALRSLARGARRQGCLPPAEAAAAAGTALEALVAALGKEAHEGTRAEILGGVGEWLGLLGTCEGVTVAPGVMEALKKGVSASGSAGAGGGGAVLLPLLLAVRDALGSSSQLQAQLQGALAEPVAKLVKEGAKRVGQGGSSPEAVVALHCLAEMAGGDVVGAAEGAQAALTDAAPGASWLFAPAQLEALMAPAAAEAARSLARLLLLGARRLGVCAVLGPPEPAVVEDESLGSRNVRPAALALVALLMHADRGVRGEAEAVAAHALQEEPATGLALLRALWVHADRAAQRMEAAAGDAGGAGAAELDESVGGKAAAATAGGPAPQRFAGALLAAVPEGAAVECLPMAMVLAGHPAVAASDRQGAALLARLVARVGGAEAVAAEFDAVSVDVSDEVIQALMAPLAAHRVAGHRAMGALAHGLGAEGRELLADGVVPGVLMQLQRPELMALPPLEVAIHLHPAGSVYQTHKLGGGAGGKDAAAAQQRRMRTGRRGNVYDAEEEKWEAEYRRKKAEEQEKQAGGQGPSPEEQKLLDEEAEVRARVGALKREAAAGLEALAALSRRAPPFAHAAIPEALPALTPLLKGELLDEEAYTALRALAASVEPAAQPVAWDLAAGVRLVSLAEEAGSSKQQAALLARLGGDVLARPVAFLAGLCSHVYRERLAAPTFALLFPILRAVLTDAAGPVALHACYGGALAILAAHAGMEDLSEAPVAGEEVGVGPTEAAILRPLRKPMVEVVLYVLEHHPRSEPEPGGILIALLMGPPLSVGEWAPLLGNAGLLSGEASVRLAVLEAVEAVATGGSAGKASLGGNPLLESRLWLARHDEDEEVCEAGERVWEARGAALSGVYAAPLLVVLTHESKRVRKAAARALAAAAAARPESATGTLTHLLELFQANAPEPVKEKARGGAGASFLAPPSADGVFAEEVDPEVAAAAEKAKAGARGGVAAALEELGKAKALDPDGPDRHLEVAFPFLLNQGVVDPDEAVRQQMVSAGMALIDAYGQGHAAALLPIFEGVLAAPAAAGEDLRAFDWRREGTVVLMGSTARHLDAADPKVHAIMDRLLDALATPSGPVQRAVALCMVPLMPACKAQAGGYAARLLEAALKGEDYGTRRGAAYGISALVKGLGIASLKQHGIMPALEEAAASPSPPAKQGALFCFECLCDRLRLLFEPYVIVILPLLLKCFSDPSDHVREAANMAAKAIMGNLSPHGVKLVLPAILKALDDSAWRSKAAALGLLGAMAYCAPKQLGSCLPQIVPRMTEAFGDTHPRVREAGKGALADIGKVIRNPEIRKLSPLLLSALHEPAKHTKDALEGLLSCEFMHSVDAPSLALLMPIVQRGLKDRAADLKRKASLITGNMCAMTADARDLNPYLPIVLPGLKAALTDPIPDVRATTARALGSLMRGMGEEALFDLVPWLIETLQTDASSVERSGGAQGLAQVLVALGDTRVKAVLGDVLALKSHPRPAVREGVLWLLSFLPPALGAGFTPYLGDALPVILAGLTDETEAVREVALRAGQVLVSTHGRHHADALLPSLELGLFDDSWRIRQSSVQLLGDLLYTIGGTKAVGLADGNDEDAGPGRGVSRAETAINSVLGPKRRARILASLYVIRSDTSAVVRQSALQVWKTIVPNTPRVLREVLPTLIELLIGALASNNLDKRTVAGRALGDIVRKLGDQILPEIVPCLRHELRVGDANMRQGVCLGLAEIMEVATKKQVEDFAATLVEAIIDALSDPAASVREQAGAAFLAFHKIVGGDAVQKIVPPMLDRLEEEQRAMGDAADADEGDGRALLGVRELLRARPRDVLGYLLPRLTRPPVSVAHARTLEAVAEVTGATLHVHASTLLPLLVGQTVAAEAAGEADEAEARRLAALRSCTRTVVTSVESNGLQHLVVDLTKLLESPEAPTRRCGAWCVAELAKGTGADLRPQAPILLKYLIPLLNDPEEAVWPPAVGALRALLERLGTEEALSHLDFMRNVVASVVSDARRRKGGVGDAEFVLPGLNVAGGLEPFMPAYTQGLLQGTPTQKEVAAAWMGELMELMTPAALRPYIAKVVGPLIRIASDKTFSPSIKCAILGTTTLLLDKGGAALRGLAPQLQTTFTKALNDPSKAVRERAATGLGRLVPLSTRVDPLVTELVTGAAASPAGVDVQAAMLKALGQVLAASGDKVSAAVVGKAADQLGGLLAHEHEPLRRAAAGAVGRVVALLPEEGRERVVKGELLARGGGADPRAVQGRALALAATLKGRADDRFVPLLDSALATLTADVGAGGSGAETAPVREAALRALAGLVGYTHAQAPGKVAGFVEALVPSLAGALADAGASSVRKAAAGLVKAIAKSDPAALRPHNVTVIPPLLEGVKDMDIRVKYVSERALLYALEIHTRPETLTEFVSSAPMEPAKFVRDYAKRILVRLKAESDDEGGEEEE